LPAGLSPPGAARLMRAASRIADRYDANAGAGRLWSGPGKWPEKQPEMTAEIVWFWKPHLGQ